MNATRALAWGLVAAAAGPPAVRAETRYAVVEAFPNLEFRRPVDLESARDGTHRLFVVEQDGMIHVFPNDPAAKSSGVFLDIRESVNRDGNEMGLLGLAFFPDFARTRDFFVDYTASKWGRRLTRVSRFEVGPYANAAQRGSEDTVIEITQPWPNHNGGQLAFGPDGDLYIALGDGGSGGDPQGNAQNRASLLGKILRLDVTHRPYAIPADNPFRGNSSGWREEVFAWGLRNPWRFSFDAATGELWAGDVGQSTWEEVDRIEKGKNYGWDCREGFKPYQPSDEQSRSCAGTTDFAEPVWAYGRSEGICVTGGYVYRGQVLPELVGWYVYGDYGTGRVWALRVSGSTPENRLVAESGLLISSFGVDDDNELYLCAHDPTDGPTKIYKLVTR